MPANRKILVSAELLKDFLRIPETWAIVGAMFDFDSRSVVLVVNRPDREPGPLTEPLPIIKGTAWTENGQLSKIEWRDEADEAPVTTTHG